MPGLAAAFSPVLREVGENVIGELDQLTEEELNLSLALPETNTAYQVATHLAAATEFWIFQMVGGINVNRHRLAEFQARGTGQQLEDRYRALMRRADEFLGRVPDNDLDRVVRPPDDFLASRAAGATAELTVFGCLLHALGHAALHQGHLQLTRQLIVAKRSADIR